MSRPRKTTTPAHERFKTSYFDQLKTTERALVRSREASRRAKQPPTPFLLYAQAHSERAVTQHAEPRQEDPERRRPHFERIAARHAESRSPEDQEEYERRHALKPECAHKLALRGELEVCRLCWGFRRKI